MLPSNSNLIRKIFWCDVSDIVSTWHHFLCSKYLFLTFDIINQSRITILIVWLKKKIIIKEKCIKCTLSETGHRHLRNFQKLKFSLHLHEIIYFKMFICTQTVKMSLFYTAKNFRRKSLIKWLWKEKCCVSDMDAKWTPDNYNCQMSMVWCMNGMFSYCEQKKVPIHIISIVKYW